MRAWTTARVWGVAGIFAVLGAASAAAPSPAGYTATITRTDFGVPHVTAPDWASLGYGTGYAFAEDNVCLLADHLVTLSGERSRYFGAEATVTVAFQDISNADSDAYFRATFVDDALAAAVASASPEYRALLRGYVAGYNRYLRKTGVAHLPAACRSAAWVRPMTLQDALRLNEDKMRLASGERFAVAMVTSAPPVHAAAVHPLPHVAVPWWDAVAGQPVLDFGSNGWAFGAEVTGGAGVLLGNPHFPWQTTNRFWQVHQTIPGQLDVMGVTLSGLPSVVIGFNRDVAWTHTVSTDRHFTFFELTLDPADPTTYLVDGQPRKLQRRTVMVPMKDGPPQSRTVYVSDFGPIVSVSALGLAWTHEHAYALKDAEELNFRAPDAWLSIERAHSVSAIQHAISEPVGIPWVNTIATDRHGEVLYADVTPTPNVTEQTPAECRAVHVPATLASMRLYVLNGAHAACAWSADPRAATAGLLRASQMPQLVRRDFVANSNDSFWLANDRAPLKGLPEIVGAVDEPQGLRTRQGLLKIHAAIEEHPLHDGHGITPAVIEQIIFGNDNLAADLILDDALTLCRTAPTATSSRGEAVELSAACTVLAQWDRKMNLDSRGAALFSEFWAALTRKTGGFPAAVPFAPSDPVHTPRGLTLEGEAGTQVRTALADAVTLLATRGVALDAPWGTLQHAARGDRLIPIHGGSGMMGVLNMQESPWREGIGYQPVHGSSYMQVVTFDRAGPVADALLSYSQSTDPASAHYADQTERYSAKTWHRLPFSAAEIQRQQRSVVQLRE